MTAVGTNVPRKEGPAKLSGAAQYVDDLALPDALFGVTVRSTVAHGKLRGLTFDPAFPWDEVVIVTANDIPGKNVVHLIEDDQPLLADDLIRHVAEPVALLAHPDRATAYRALEHVTVDVDPLDPVLDMDAALDRGAVQTSLSIDKGDGARALADADVVVEGSYHVPHQEQAYIETNGMAAWWTDDGAVVLQGSMQCPYYIEKALGPILGLPPEQIRIIQAETGGGFGGKEEYPNLIAGHAALLARKARRPVKIIYDRHEDMLATTKRHPARIHHRTGLSRDGKLVAQVIDIVMDAGAYVTLSPVVLSRGILHAAGPYTCPHVEIRAHSVTTNTPPNGAFRGFGAPQTLFAAELHWERIASQLGRDVVELKQINLIRPGGSLATGQIVTDSVGAEECLTACLERSDYAKTRRAHDRWNAKRKNPTWRGIGVSVVHHGAGFTGSGEVMLNSVAAVELTQEGRVRVEASSTEIGQGTNSIFAQVVADTMGIPYDRIEVLQPDTSRVPDSGPTVASRTCMVVGGLIAQAAQELADLVGETHHDREWRARVKDLTQSGPVRREARYQRPPEVQWDEVNYRGDAYPVYSYAAAVADVEIDRSTFEVTVHRFLTAQDIGHAVHPLLVEGQILGGTVQGLGYALLENPVYEDGAMQNAQFTNYTIPTFLDVPRMDVTLVEKPYARGPFGAKGVGELPMDVPGPAVAAAVHHALGRVIDTLPITPERICAELKDVS